MASPWLCVDGDCNSSLLGPDGCDLARQAGAGPSFWQPFLPIWLIGLVVGGIVLLVMRSSRKTTAPTP